MALTVDQALHQGVAAHKEGKLQDAERLYRAILQAQPSHPDANHNLGILTVAVGKPLDAIPLFKRALETNPQIEQFWMSYIGALIKVERFDDAKRVLVEGEKSGVSSEKLEFLHQQIPKSPPDINNQLTKQSLTISEKRTKLAKREKSKKTEARGSSPRAAPSQDQINCLLGHYQAGRLLEAEELAALLTQQFPKHPFGWEGLAAVLLKSGRLAESLAPMQVVVKLSPQNAEAHSNLGNLLKELGRFEDAEASYRQAITVKPELAEAHSNLGVTLNLLGRLDEAEASYRQAIALKPDYAEAHSNLGSTLTVLGRLDEAETSYRQAVTLKPDYAEAHRNLATMKKFSSEDEQFLQMQVLYRDPATSEKNRCHICFALARAHEDVRDFTRAFQLYAEGNALRKKELGYNKAADERSFESLKANYQQISDAAGPEIVASEHAPIFIVAMPRSGTTLVEQIISSHPLVTGAGELPFVAQFGSSIAVGQSPVNAEALTIFRDEYFNALRQRSEGNAIVTDKMPQNFRFLGLIIAAIPGAKVIHVKRDPAAVCWANYTQYFDRDSLGYCYDLEDILHYYHLYNDLMQYWHQVLPGRIYDLDYEALTKHQEEETRKLIGHLGLDWNDACLSPQENNRCVATASNIQVRKKVYRGSSEKWKRYLPFLNGALDHFSVGNQ